MKRVIGVALLLALLAAAFGLGPSPALAQSGNQ